MWFKNLQVYRMTNWAMAPAALEERLSNHALQKCLSMEMQSRGWVFPKDENGKFVHALGQDMLITLGIEKKLLPAAVINQLTKERASEIARQQGFEPGRKQIKDIKESVLAELLPRAFALRRKTNAWIDPVGGWFVIDTSSTGKADEFIEVLFKTVDDVTLKPLKTNLSPAAAMTGWLSRNEVPASFTIDRQCELRGMDDEKATVSYIRHDLGAKEICGHIQTGKEATKLAMTWRDKISFILHENMQIKRITPLDLLKEPAETAEEQFDGDFAIMTGEFKQLLADIIEVLDGEESNH
jgi:recombination associated protein RdgC